MKLSSAFLVLAALFTAPILVSAAEAAHPATQQQAMHFPRWARDPVAFATRRLGDLGKKLDIKPAQQAAWQKYSAAIIARARERKLHWEQMKLARHASREELSTPERMAKIADRLRQAADRMSRLASDTKDFYGQLGAEQKTIFDLYAKAEWRGARLARGKFR